MADLDLDSYAMAIAEALARLNLIDPNHPDCDHCAWVLQGHLLELDFLVGPGQEHDVIRRLGADYSRSSHSAGLG